MKLIRLLIIIVLTGSAFLLLASPMLSIPRSLQIVLFIFVGAVVSVELISIVRYGRNPLNLFYPVGSLESVAVPDTSQLGQLVLEEDRMRGEINPPYVYRVGMRVSLYENFIVVRSHEQVDNLCAALIPLGDVSKVVHRVEPFPMIGVTHVVEVHYRTSETPLKFYPDDASKWIEEFRDLLDTSVAIEEPGPE